IISTRKHDFFYKSESIPDMRSSLGTTKKDFVYGLYDELVDKYPELVSKKTLGYGYNTSGEIDESFPIYEYTFSPAQTLQMSQDEQSTLLT
ncbi:hypothetical protein, partial [Salmonella enterica]|uniref:hypothetical protein n=1 Tax=Salmonella enterica TaxID=28901 RepID=UPI00148223E2